MTATGAPALEEGQEIARVQLALPGPVFIDCAAQVRHVTPISERQDGTRYRVGLSFVDLPSAAAVAIQRFITKTEHQRRGLESGA